MCSLSSQGNSGDADSPHSGCYNSNLLSRTFPLPSHSHTVNIPFPPNILKRTIPSLSPSQATGPNRRG